MHAAFLAAARADPDDPVPGLVYADWLEEHGEPGVAADLRAEPRLAWHLARILRPSFLPGGVLPAADPDRFTRAVGGFLARFPELVVAPPPVRAPAPAADAAALAQFAADWHAARYDQVRAVRDGAARLAAFGGAVTVPTPAADPLKFEGQCGLLYELLLRGRLTAADVVAALGEAGHPPARLPRQDLARVGAVVRRMQEAGHPLARLPLQLLPIERDIPAFLPRYSPDGVGWSNPARDAAAEPLAPDAPTRPAVAAVDDLPAYHAALAAVRLWGGESEARQVTFARPVAAADLSVAWFRGAGFASFGAATERPVGRWVPADRAFAVLFCAAQNGGAYSSGERSAYGRLAAWQALAGLVGLPPAAACEEVAAAAGECLWVEYEGTGWFHDVAWDLGLVCVRPDRRSLVVLAATDTD